MGRTCPMMLGLQTELVADDQGRIIPAERYGVRVVSMGFLTQEDSAVIWRGPMLHGAIQQFFRQVALGQPRLPDRRHASGHRRRRAQPQPVRPCGGAIVVTTPQQVSLADTRRAVRMYQKLNIRALGLIENMSHFECPNCGHESDIFGKGAGEGLAHASRFRSSADCRSTSPSAIGGDSGHPIVLAEPDSAAARAFRSPWRSRPRRRSRSPATPGDSADAGQIKAADAEVSALRCD